ncbi:MAG: hypothetical protein AAF311_10290 [Pseudomonadota bacterium]
MAVDAIRHLIVPGFRRGDETPCWTLAFRDFKGASAFAGPGATQKKMRKGHERFYDQTREQTTSDLSWSFGKACA